MPITEKQKKFFEKMGWPTDFVTKRMAIKQMKNCFEGGGVIKWGTKKPTKLI